MYQILHDLQPAVGRVQLYDVCQSDVDRSGLDGRLERHVDDSVVYGRRARVLVSGADGRHDCVYGHVEADAHRHGGAVELRQVVVDVDYFDEELDFCWILKCSVYLLDCCDFFFIFQVLRCNLTN